MSGDSTGKPPDHEKPFSTLRANAAMSGFTCEKTQSGNIVLGRIGAGWIFGNEAAASEWLANLTKEIQQ